MAIVHYLYKNSVLAAVAFLIIATSTIAVPLPLEYEARSRFVCPEMKSATQCSCSFVISDYEINCPIYDPNIIIRIQPSTYVQIECANMHEKDYALLPLMNIGDIPRVQIRRCPLPIGKSIQAILDRIGIGRTRALLFQSYGTNLGTTLVRDHLKGLGELERLVLSGNNLSDLPEDLFMDVGNLTWLDLKSNKVHLPRDIFRNLEKLDYLELGYNNLQHLEEGVFRNQKRLKSLNLWGNELKNLTKNSFLGISSISELDLSSNKLKTLEPDVFALLGHLTNINLGGNNFTSLPEGLFAHNKQLIRLRLLENREVMETLPSGLLSNLPVLEDVRIKCYLRTLPGNLFTGSVNLRNISLMGNQLEAVPVSLLAQQANLLDLDISNNKLTELPDDLLANTSTLIVLKLSHNQLVYISRDTFSHLRNLQILQLDNNNLHNIHINAFATSKSLQILDLHNNHLFNEELSEIDTEFFGFESHFQNLQQLTSLNLRNNSIRRIFGEWNQNTPQLQELDLSYNNISMLADINLQFASKYINVNLTHNSIEEIDFRMIQSLEPPEINIANVYLGDNPIICNCIILHFVQYVRGIIAPDMRKRLKIIPEELKCTSPDNLEGRLVTQVQPKELLCPLDNESSSIKKCPSQCICMVRPVDKALIINCSNAGIDKIPALPRTQSLQLHFIELHVENNNLVKLPRGDQPGYADVREIYAKNNNISKFTIENMPKNLTVLDLSSNHLSWLNVSVLNALNHTNQLERVLLANNPWKCNCDARPLLSFVRTNFKKIEDLSTMQCSTGQKLSSISFSDICTENETILIAVSVIIAFLGLFIGILAALYYKYQQEVKVWLFAHNMFLWFVTEEELDKDKIYDAFISYSHKDEEFITEHLVPRLENGPNPFKLCIHVRNWTVGEFIANQITKSVENSRRTIVILSPNFLESVWGRMEFRAAHKAALTEGRARVIVIIYGDIGDTGNLDPELKAYLNMNTYVKWGDPWFWDKLYYAMPHPSNHNRSIGLVKTSIKSSTDDKLELIKPIPVTPPLTTPPAEQASKNPLVSKLNGDVHQNGKILNGINGHVNGAFIINTNAKQSDV